MKRKRQQGKRRSSKKPKNSNTSSEIIIKNFEIFVTDFLIDPCGLPLELKDCILVDETKKPIHEHSDISSSSNNSHVLKKIFTNSLPIEATCSKSE